MQLKGAGEHTFIFGFVAFMGIVLFLTAGAIGFGVNLSIFNDFNPTIFAGSMLVVAGTCVIATGLPCAGVLLLTTVFNFVTAPAGNLAILLLLTPLLVTIAYIFARLGRGQGG